MPDRRSLPSLRRGRPGPSRRRGRSPRPTLVAIILRRCVLRARARRSLGLASSGVATGRRSGSVAAGPTVVAADAWLPARRYVLRFAAAAGRERCGDQQGDGRSAHGMHKTAESLSSLASEVLARVSSLERAPEQPRRRATAAAPLRAPRHPAEPRRAPAPSRAPTGRLEPALPRPRWHRRGWLPAARLHRLLRYP